MRSTTQLPAIAAMLALSFVPAAAQYVHAHDYEPCSNHQISAKAVRTLNDVRVFVECAHEYIQENGPEEALRAFNEDERWRHGSTYVFVLEISRSGVSAETFVLPTVPARQGTLRGTPLLNFGNDYYAEVYRIMAGAGAGWVYYTTPNPATGQTELKASYLIELEWNGKRAVVGSGVYPPDIPGRCEDELVNAAALTADPSDDMLRAFVRCAALLVESEGYLAKGEIERGTRWRDGTSYAYVLDGAGEQIMTGLGFRVNGIALHEWGGRHAPRFGGRGMADVGQTFGESLIYYKPPLTPYRAADGPESRPAGKVAFQKRVVSGGVPVLVAAGYDPASRPAEEPGPTCAHNSVMAEGVRTADDIEAFVRCAAEYLQERGTAEARRAFNEDERWNSGPTYVFVDEVASSGSESTTFVFPPDPAREGTTWGPLVDNFGTDFFFELERVLEYVDAGWIHYAFTNPATGLTEPKSSYVMEVDWDGARAGIGAGVYEPHLPGTCDPHLVNAQHLEEHPVDEHLVEFVRCAAYMAEEHGLFASPILSSDPRWLHGSIYVFGVDISTGAVIFSGSASSFAVSGQIPERLFGGRDLIEVGDAFGEAFWYYDFTNPASGMQQRKVSFVRRVHTAQGAILVGAGYNP